MTIFHKIINKEIPSNIIFEDEDILVILDAFPMTYGHTLVLPKKFSKNILEMDIDNLKIVMEKTQKIAKEICDKLNADGCNILTNVNEEGEQSIPYTHIHIVPRYGKEYKIYNHISQINDIDFIELLNKIKN